MMRMLPNIPGQPHQYAREIAAWAEGRLVQWRYCGSEATDADWRDCDYPSRGMPNWHNGLIEFRVAPAGVMVDASGREVDAQAAIAAGFKNHGYRQGTKECVAFYRGACWQLAAGVAIPQKDQS